MSHSSNYTFAAMFMFNRMLHVQFEDFEKLFVKFIQFLLA